MADHFREDRASGHTGLLVAGLALGAAAMYLADPEAGRRRRARLRDRYAHASHLLQRGADIVLRDASHRAAGTAAALRGWIDARNAGIDDVVLEERLRSALGRATAHSHALKARVVGGNVTLTGDAFAREAPRIVACVERTRGVSSVDNRLRLHETTENFPTLLGHGHRGGARFEPLQENWSPAWRSLAGAIGAGLALAGWIRGGLHGLALGTTGAGMFARAVTNRDLRALVGIDQARRGVVVRKTVHIDAPVEEVYRHWTIESFPGWMSHVRSVKPLGDGRHHWVVDGPAGVAIEWDSEITHAVENRELEWRAVPGSMLDNAGRVHFTPEAGGTRVQVTLCYLPVGGLFGHAIARALGADPKSRMDDDLMRFKGLIETGNPAHDSAGRRSRPAWLSSDARH
jgi:uncharacterized membrane protein